MFEKIIFNLLAFSIFIIIFFKIIRKNDTNYLLLLLMETIGITISFIEIKLGIDETLVFGIIRYVFSVIFPLMVIIMEFNGKNFSEIISIGMANFFIIIADTKSAKSILVKLVSKYPESYLGHKLLAKLYEKEGGMRRAIDEYVTAVDLKRDDYKSYFKITELLRELGKKDEAIEMLENLTKIKPDCYEASCLLGELLCEQERFKEAANVYNEALLYRPLDYDLYYNLGIVYTRLSDFQMAKEMYEKAAEINHKLYGAHYNLGQIAFIQMDYELAEKYFERSLYGELEAMSYYQLARIYAYKGEKDKAINFLNKAIELDFRLLKLAEKEKTFEKIKEYITVSVKMDRDENKENQENIQNKNSIILKEQEKLARMYLENTTRLIEQMKENTSKQKIEERVNLLFKSQRLKKEEKELEKSEKEKIEKNKELGTN